ncbi:MAG: hypothetical protein RBT73_07670 [Spirochaetia bacterium]|nr:hypothetical protein [Spirochaetia bacterium]
MKEVTGDVSSRTAVDETGVEDPGGMETQLKVLLSSPLAKGMMIKLFDHPHKYGFSSTDEAAEALLHYSGRFLSILRKSIDITDKKDAYIDKSLRFIAKSVQRYNRRKELMDSLLANSSALTASGLDSADQCCRDGFLNYSHDSASCIDWPAFPDATDSFSEASSNRETRRFIGEINPSVFVRTMGAQNKRLLFLTVKCAWEVDDAIARRVARKLGVPALWLETLLNKARATLEPQRLSLERLTERINETWGRILYLESELRSDYNPRMRQELEQRIIQQRQRYTRLLERKARMRPLVAHKDIAFLLGLPKGSIDSGLFYLKEGRGRKIPYCA